MAKGLLNFHFDFLTTSLIKTKETVMSSHLYCEHRSMQNAQVTKSRININLDRPWILDYLRQRLRKNITDPMNS